MRFLIVAASLTLGWTCMAGEIALSFDDAPRSDGERFTGAERTLRLVQGLERAGVEQVVFFVTTGNIGEDGAERLRQYARAGHLLANHSHSHRHPDRMGVAAYLADIRRAHGILKDFPNFRPWYRYPFLDEGREQATRNGVLAGLKALGYRNGYVTVDNYDFYIEHLYQGALRDGLHVDLDKLKAAYLDILWQCTRFYDEIGKAVLGRSPKHVLLLHENDIAALFIEDLVAMYRAKGWRIIPAEEAYGDPIASVLPQTIWQNQGRVAAIARDQGYRGRDLLHASEDETYLETYLREKGVFGD